MAVAAIVVFSFLSIGEVIPPRSPIMRVMHFTASKNIKGESVEAVETATHELPADGPSLPGAVSVPEPASLMLLAPALVLLAGRKRRT